MCVCVCSDRQNSMFNIFVPANRAEAGCRCLLIIYAAAVLYYRARSNYELLSTVVFHPLLANLCYRHTPNLIESLVVFKTSATQYTESS